MSGVGLILARFAAIVAGYAVAALVASAFLHLLFLGPLGWTGEEAVWVATGSMISSISFVALFIAYAAFIPAMAVVGIAEVLGRRDWLFYAIAGALVGAAVIALLRYTGAPADAPVGDGAAGYPPFGDPGVLAVLTGAGIVGGIAFWAVAGRGAGSWRRPPSAPGPSGS